MPFVAVVNYPTARSCSLMAAVGVFALEALRAWDCACKSQVSEHGPELEVASIAREGIHQ